MKTAVVLFNLGGPDGRKAVRPFLFNLFNDKAIIGAPQPVRWLLAQLISRRRAPIAQTIYDQIGGKSPILELTNQQATALQHQLSDDGDFQVFVSMRYWHPFSDETAKRVREYNPDTIVLLPLYPQFSTTTTGSSLNDWHRAAAKAGIQAPSQAICCYPENPGFTDAVRAGIETGLAQASQNGNKPRVLFSAHGLPKKIVDAGDPYPEQVELSVRKIVEKLAIDDLDWCLCYQSRVGPLEWIGPSTDDEIRRAGEDGKSVVMVPIAFVSEHSETLVELDIEYRELAEENGIPAYVRTPAVGDDADFIGGLKNLVLEALNGRDLGEPRAVNSGDGKRACPEACPACPMNAGK